MNVSMKWGFDFSIFWELHHCVPIVPYHHISFISLILLEQDCVSVCTHMKVIWHTSFLKGCPLEHGQIPPNITCKLALERHVFRSWIDDNTWNCKGAYDSLASMVIDWWHHTSLKRSVWPLDMPGQHGKENFQQNWETKNFGNCSFKTVRLLSIAKRILATNFSLFPLIFNFQRRQTLSFHWLSFLITLLNPFCLIGPKPK